MQSGQGSIGPSVRMAPSKSGEAPSTSTSKVSPELTVSMDTSMESTFETLKSSKRFNWNFHKKGTEFIREYCEELGSQEEFRIRDLFRR